MGGLPTRKCVTFTPKVQVESGQKLTGDGTTAIRRRLMTTTVFGQVGGLEDHFIFLARQVSVASNA